MKPVIFLVVSAMGCAVLFAQPVADAGAKIDQAIAALPQRKVADPNPALLYWQAIAMLPELKQEQMRLIGEVLDGKVSASSAKVTTFLDGTSKSLERFARAAACAEPCVWGTTFDEGPFAPMPHLSKLQVLSRLALVQCESLFATGRHEQALHWVLNVHRAARHAGADALLMTVVMQHGIEQQAIRLTARHALALDDATRSVHEQALKQLPPLHTVREALTGEHALADWLRHMVLGIEHSPESEKALLDMAQSLLQAQSQPGGEASASAKQTLASIEEWKQLAEQARALQSRLEAASTKPWKDFQKDIEQIRSDFAKTGGTLLGQLPGIEGAMRKQFETMTLQTMLEASLAVGAALNEGELASHTDSFGGHPLLVNKDAEGFSIVTRGKMRDRQVSLRVGK